MLKISRLRNIGSSLAFLNINEISRVYSVYYTILAKLLGNFQTLNNLIRCLDRLFLGYIPTPLALDLQAFIAEITFLFTGSVVIVL
jgi:hypothetical protein